MCKIPRKAKKCSARDIFDTMGIPSSLSIEVPQECKECIVLHELMIIQRILADSLLCYPRLNPNLRVAKGWTLLHTIYAWLRLT